jgi:hypothetical protein
MLTSLVLAALSWRLVEQPLRRVRLPRARHLAGFVAASLVLTLTAAVTIEPAAAARPANGRMAHVLQGLRALPDYRIGSCFISSGSRAADFDVGRCLRSRSAAPDVLLLGDSHAADLWEGLQDAMPQVDLLQATASGCKPLVPLRGQDRCTGVMAAALGGPLAGSSVSTVILAARWQLDDLDRLTTTLALLRKHGRRVVVLGPTTEYFSALPKLLARGIATGNAGVAASSLDHRRFAVEARLAPLVREADAVYVSQLAVLCARGACREYAADGTPLKSDYGHYTRSGAEEIARLLAPEILP